MIIPTVGRIVWYYPAPNDNLPRLGNDPLAAMIVAVWGDRRVNLAVFDANGSPQARSSVHLVQPEDGEERPSAGCAAWMPSQIGAAGIAPIISGDPPEGESSESITNQQGENQ